MKDEDVKSQLMKLLGISDEKIADKVLYYAKLINDGTTTNLVNPDKKKKAQDLLDTLRANNFALAKELNLRAEKIIDLIATAYQRQTFEATSIDVTQLNKSYVLLVNELEKLYSNNKELSDIEKTPAWKYFGIIEGAEWEINEYIYENRNDSGQSHIAQINRLCIIAGTDKPKVMTDNIKKILQDADTAISEYKAKLDEQGFTNRSGKPISVSQILVILSTPFYYGKFQYPESPDAPWYTGAHKPLISKELFDLVQETRGVYKGVWGTKTFAFRGILKCGQCDADITAQDKFKLLKSGDTKRFVYYNCTRRKDPDCKEKYVNEEKLCELLQAFIEQHHQEMAIEEKLRAKVDKHFYVTKTLLNHYKIERDLDNPFVEYSRYILASGTEGDRIRFASGIKTKLQIRHGELEFYA